MAKTLQEKYHKEAVPALVKKFGYRNRLQVPRILKVVVNSGIGKRSSDPSFAEKILPEITNSFANIVGQKPAVTSAKKSIAGFKIRQGQAVGLKATLRGKRMFDFLTRFISVALPRVRDFRGVSSGSIDKSGNLNIGLKEHIVFPEIDQDTARFDFGIEVSIISNAKRREEAIELYKLLGFPLKKE